MKIWRAVRGEMFLPVSGGHVGLSVKTDSFSSVSLMRLNIWDQHLWDHLSLDGSVLVARHQHVHIWHRYFEPLHPETLISLLNMHPSRHDQNILISSANVHTHDGTISCRPDGNTENINSEMMKWEAGFEASTLDQNDSAWLQCILHFST